MDIILEDWLCYRNLSSYYRFPESWPYTWSAGYHLVLWSFPSQPQSLVRPVSHPELQFLIFLLPILNHHNLFQHWLQVAKITIIIIIKRKVPNASVTVLCSRQTVALECLAKRHASALTTPISFLSLNISVTILSQTFLKKESYKPSNILQYVGKGRLEHKKREWLKV